MQKINNDVFAYVFPHLIYENSQLNNISNEYNGLLVESAFSDKQFLQEREQEAHQLAQQFYPIFLPYHTTIDMNIVKSVKPIR